MIGKSYLFLFLNLQLIFILKDLNSSTLEQDKEFIILIASYNNKDWYKRNLDSVFSQTYKNYKVIYMDDVSIDGTGSLVAEYIKEKNQEDKVELIINKEKYYCLGNYFKEIHKIPNHKIIVTLDGDDWFAHERVLEYLNNVYLDSNVWLTYGQLKTFPKNALSLYSSAYPDYIISENLFRKYKWSIMHLRSFYAGLFKKINYEDLTIKGKFFSYAEDVAFMIPMIEMSGFNHRYISDVLYVYNRENVLNSTKVIGCDEIMRIYNIIVSRKPYEPLLCSPAIG